MLKSEIKKKTFTTYFWISVVLMLLMFLCSDAGRIFSGTESETVLSLLIAKSKGRWVRKFETYSFVLLQRFFTGNYYLPVVMPIICGLPGLGIYLEEIKSGNSRFLLSRTSRKKYYVGKLLSQALAAALAAFFAIVVYLVIVMLFFDKPRTSDFDFSILYVTVKGKNIPGYPEITAADIKEMNIIYLYTLRSAVLFMFYAAKSSIFCLAVAALVKDSYLTVGFTVVLSYLQLRLSEAVGNSEIKKSLNRQKFTRISDLISPDILGYVNQFGSLEKRGWLYILITLLASAFWVLVYIAVNERQLDAAE